MKNACTPDLSVLLIDSRKLEGDFVEAFLWWSKVLNLSERFEISPFHFKHLILFSYINLSYFGSKLEILFCGFLQIKKLSP
jgi:hypothetical protein